MRSVRRVLWAILQPESFSKNRKFRRKKLADYSLVRLAQKTGEIHLIQTLPKVSRPDI